jgi:mono/diheme cytochrome c family protein
MIRTLVFRSACVAALLCLGMLRPVAAEADPRIPPGPPSPASPRIPRTPRPQAPKAAAVPRAKALELFAANCAMCHGPEGAGTPISPDMAFKNRKWKHGSRQQDVVATITNGVPATPMLPFKGRLSPAEINALASLVRSFDKSLKPAGGKR